MHIHTCLLRATGTTKAAPDNQKPILEESRKLISIIRIKAKTRDGCALMIAGPMLVDASLTQSRSPTDDKLANRAPLEVWSASHVRRPASHLVVVS
jgi:hypothetical protein